MARYRGQSVFITDKRVRMMSEILNCIKLIKLYAWESSFAEAVGKLQREQFYVFIKKVKLNYFFAKLT